MRTRPFLKLANTSPLPDTTRKLAKEKSDILIIIGMRAKFIKEGAISSGMDSEKILQFENSIQAGEFLKDFLKKGDLCLIKGSQGMRMERTVEEVIADKENKKHLLVRQDKEWKKR